jgi:hypothetical protein
MTGGGGDIGAALIKYVHGEGLFIALREEEWR